VSYSRLNHNYGKLASSAQESNKDQNIIFILSEDKTNVYVDLKIHDLGRSELIGLTSYWYGLVEELWGLLGVRIEKEDFQRYYPKKDDKI